MRLQKQQPLTVLAATLVLASLAGPRAFGQEAPKAPTGNTLELGFEERVRSEEWNNIKDFSDGLNDGHLQYRMRTRIWAQYNLGADLELSAGIANENRKLVRPDAAFNGREIFFDSLYAKYRFNADWTAKVGRQNIMKGEGFILMDGGALDGSRTGYYNAVDITRSFGADTLELIALSDPTRDKYLPRLNATDNPKELMRLNEWDEQAVGLYYTGKPAQGTTLEGYYFYKTELHDYRAASNPMFQPDRRLSTLGGRVTQSLGQGWSLAGELAGQSGTQDANPVQKLASKSIGAWAGYARAKKAFEAPWKPSVSLAYIGMSGTDPSSNKIGGWDPLFSRWPAYSELYIYTQAYTEKGVGYWTNTSMWQAEVRVAPCSRLELRGTYYKMAAFQAPAAVNATFGAGKNRGDLYQLRADLKLNGSLKGHVLYEHLAPGSFYAGRDPGSFFRMELSCLFKALL